jgi:hypothetical protein
MKLFSIPAITQLQEAPGLPIDDARGKLWVPHIDHSIRQITRNNSVPQIGLSSNGSSGMTVDEDTKGSAADV